MDLGKTVSETHKQTFELINKITESLDPQKTDRSDIHDWIGSQL